MSTKITLSIPEELMDPHLFTKNDSFTIDEHALTHILPSMPFLYEAAYYLGINAKRPWELREECIPILLNEWNSEKEFLKKVFAKRERTQVTAPMKKGICLFLEFVYWGNGLPVSLTNYKNAKSLIIKPVNMVERLEFILHRPTLYHSFIQLSELMIEMEKLYVKQIALKKASQH
ncbi:YpoC family protein [Cytobacillus dafuensis]|uniref:YpoC-like domain-containing protein n=1 Tax=Cytobacillus dafuensis TaxID=1742359 RepID=A0A5B8Z5N1_CYTDA|nr:hypothetical protein [Cytobacillus dafuensis]QED48402.1 hypothetical protein FSZ17_14775 [Cytobacillus dafuensis]